MKYSLFKICIIFNQYFPVFHYFVYNKLLYFTDMIVITMLQMEGQEIELDNDQRVLSYYSIDPGDVIQVKI